MCILDRYLEQILVHRERDLMKQVCEVEKGLYQNIQVMRIGLNTIKRLLKEFVIGLYKIDMKNMCMVSLRRMKHERIVHKYIFMLMDIHYQNQIEKIMVDGVFKILVMFIFQI